MKISRALIVEDEELIRRGLLLTLKEELPDWEIEEARDGQVAVKKAVEFQPDVILMDHEMPRLKGLDAAAEIIRKDPESKIIMVTSFDSQDNMMSAISIGIKGFLPKGCSPRELKFAINKVAKGGFHFPEKIQVLAENHDKLKRNTAGPNTSFFSEREMDVLRLVVVGINSAVIAEELHISKRTVDKHRSNLLKKSGVENTPALITLTLKMGWLNG